MLFIQKCIKDLNISSALFHTDQHLDCKAMLTYGSRDRADSEPTQGNEKEVDIKGSQSDSESN